MGGGMDGWRDGWVEGWMGGWVEGTKLQQWDLVIKFASTIGPC